MKDGGRDGRGGLDFSHLNFVKNKKVINLGKSHVIEVQDKSYNKHHYYFYKAW